MVVCDSAIMSCLVAILNTDGAPIDRRILAQMIDLLPYDGAAARVWIDGSIGLACVPLRSRLPAASLRVTERAVVMIDGRLDDQTTLAARVNALPRSEVAADVDLALAAYASWGTGCAEHLVGDFALCAWDIARRQLFWARDQLGVKPLYYARLGTTLIVSNVLRAVRRHRDVSMRLDDLSTCDLLLFGACLEPSHTSFADIARLPPAHTLTCSEASPEPRVRRYWSLDPGPECRFRDPQEYVDCYLHTLDVAVRDRTRGQPVAIMMSGGLDSTSVAAGAARAFGPTARTNVRGFTAAYETVAADYEPRYASMVGEWLGVEVEQYAVDGYELFARWDRDLLPPEPSTEAMTAMMADLLDRVSMHADVLLTGDGGDPLLLPATVLHLLGRVPVFQLARDLWRSARAGAPAPLGVRSAIHRWRSPPTRVPVWLTAAFRSRIDPHARVEEIARRRRPANTRRGASLASLLDPWWTSMFETYDPGATGRAVEFRYPLFDVRLISLLLTFPTHPWFIDKQLLRKAMRGRLPDAILSRPKSPLAVDLFDVHRRWSVEEAARVFEGVPELEPIIDIAAFRASVRSSGMMTEDEPGTLAAVSLASWLRCAAATSIAA
jgi:asparagine synthase (glutamine-hydrolysing)